MHLSGAELQWGVIERVSTGVYLRVLGQDDQAHLAAASRLVS